MFLLPKPRAGWTRITNPAPLGWATLLNVGLCATLVLCVALAAPDNRRIGTALHIALPLAALACATLQGRPASAIGRFTVVAVGINLPKRSLGEHPINRRPDGGGRGFPSAHTAAATFGAVHLLYHCASLHPLTKGILLIGAAVAGGSRIEAGRHTLWQTIAGAALGWAAAALPWTLRRKQALVRARMRDGTS